MRKKGAALRETFQPMSLANMRQNGVRAVIATCDARNTGAATLITVPKRKGETIVNAFSALLSA